MNYDISKIRDILISIFSSSGYQMGTMAIKCPSPIDISITNQSDTVDINFNNNLPTAIIEKFIKFNLNITGMTLGKDGGIIKIKHFPDIKFDYSGSLKFGSNDNSYLIGISNDINLEYQDEARRKIAKRCLQYGGEWATIVSSEQDIKNATRSEKKKLRKQCYNFILENAKNDKEIVCGSVILTILIINILLPIIINWIVTKILNHWWNS
jgi:hypothetical protein